MTEIRREPQHHSGIHLSDILFALFKRKWTIILCAAVGIITAAAFYLLYPPVYESNARLLVRYVLERRAVDPIDNTNGPNVTGKTTDSIIDAEVQILTSWDLAVQVADAIGAKRLRAPSKEAAAGSIILGLKVTTAKGSDVIFISYKDRSPEMATLVLQELLSRYFVKHLEVHRSAGAFDFVTQQTDQVRARLNQTEDSLKSLRDKTGIVSLKDGSEAITTEAAKTQEQLNDAETELAEQKALVVNQTAGSKSKNGWKTKSSSSEKSPESEKAQVAGTQAKVEALKSRLRDIQQRRKQLSELTPQMEELDRKRELDETNYKYFVSSSSRFRSNSSIC